ncbi:DUF4058 family protein [Kovacikia minuta CCNUW1]|uniref:DUF4058 family protein n=1 Tax=Kovacikia minuta TaxID=2931930 RepID=UPI001CCA9AA6|nr:DUF4058 family protein [Kovacikia minuta]UBF25561.1 DUF4058 family protein [Kovacikia minuta CCNUW1]
MPSPFPGMDPYLEQPAFWSSFHQRLLVAIADAIGPQLRPTYYAEVETRTYLDEQDEQLLVGIPDALVMRSARANSSVATNEEAPVATRLRPVQVQLPMPEEVKERYLEVREVGTDAVIAVLEVLSPKNKRSGEGRTVYEKKRRTVLSSLSHLVEIDLLRSGSPMAMVGATETHYRLLVSRAIDRPTADLYSFNLPDPIPSFPLPLKSPDADINVNLQEIFAGVYDRASYDLRLDYSLPIPPPALSQADQQWLDRLLTPLRTQDGIE